MINTLAHITTVEFPAGLLLFLAGFAAGALAVSLARRSRTN